MRSYTVLTFLSALLLFMVQPLMARAVLPWFGGAAAVWTTSLLFYQTLLFGGYAYAHLGRRLGVRRQALLHVSLVGLSLLLLPLSANVRETRSTQRIRVGRRQRKRTCWDCEREWKRMVVPLEPGRPSEARQLLRTRR